MLMRKLTNEDRTHVRAYVPAHACLCAHVSVFTRVPVRTGGALMCL